MRTSIAVFLLSFLLNATHVAAQNEEPSPARFYFNSFQSGGLFGEKDKGTSFTFSTIHGVQINHFRLGAGLGYDSYQRWRTLPVFGALSFDIARLKENNLFVMVNGGYSTAWFRRQSEFEPRQSRAGGVMINPSVGYRIKAGKWNVSIAAGYKWQRLRYTTSSPYYWGYYSDWGDTEVMEKIERLVIQMGFGIN
jgi:hypothetical protein